MVLVSSYPWDIANFNCAKAANFAKMFSGNLLIGNANIANHRIGNHGNVGKLRVFGDRPLG